MSAAGPQLVVGYDGSPAARAAVGFALRRATGGGHVIIVRAFDVPREPGDALAYGDQLETAAEDAVASITALVDSDPRFATVDWERMVVIGEPAEVLVRIAAERDADEIVLGSRGLGRLDALHGSVAHDVLHRADRPVTVMPLRMVDPCGELRNRFAGAPDGAATPGP